MINPTIIDEDLVIFAGVGKCGTSWLYSYLNMEPGLRLPVLKEPYILSADAADRKALIAAQYSEGQSPILDFSNTYYRMPETDKALSEFRSTKVVLTIREPAERALSHYRYIKSNGRTNADSFADYLRSGDPLRVVDASDYVPIIRRYEDLVGQQQLLILPLEVLRTAPSDYLGRLHNFLHLSSSPRPDAAESRVRVARKARFAPASRAAKALAVSLRSRGLLGPLARAKRSRSLDRLLFSTDTTDSQPEIVEGRRTSKRLDALSTGYEDLLKHYDY